MPCSGPLSLRELRFAVEGVSTQADLLSLFARFRLWLSVKDNLPCLAGARPRDAAAAIGVVKTSHPSLWTGEVAEGFLVTMKAFRAALDTCESARRHAEAKLVAAAGMPDTSSCHPKFQEAYSEFYCGDHTRVLAAVNKALADLKASKEFRPLTIQGSGADHVMHVVSLRGGQELQLQGVRLLAEAALHDDTETAFFNKGAVEAAMRIGREATDMETRCHAARLFFNLAYLKQNRAQFIAKGGLKHIEHLAFHTEGDTSTGTAQKLILFAAKTLYQLSCHDECAAAVFQYPRFKDVWLLFSRHAAGDVRQRAAGVFNKVIDLNIGGPRVHRAWCKYMVEEVLYGLMASDTNPNAVTAQNKAKQVSDAEGWRWLDE